MKKVIYSITLISILFSQASQSFVLKEVKVEGNVVSSVNTIIFTSGLRKGLNITTAEFPRAIKRLWQLGLFDDVQIRYDDEKNNEDGYVKMPGRSREENEAFLQLVEVFIVQVFLQLQISLIYYNL